MAGKDSLRELVESLRKGRLEGSIEIEMGSEGKINRIVLMPRQGSSGRRSEGSESEVEESIRKVQFEGPELKGADLSETSISGDLSGLDLSRANFSYARIEEADMSGANLEGADFRNAELSQTDLSNSRHLNPKGAYLTGSVNLYNAKEDPSAMGDVYRTAQDLPSHYRRYDYDRPFFGKKEPEGHGDYY